MNWIKAVTIFLFLCFSLAGLTAESSTVLEVKIHGAIDLGVAYHLERAIEEAEKEGAVLLIDIDTFGGRVDAATRMSKALLNSPVKSIVYVNSKAISAGALIAISAEKIYGSEYCTFGDVQPQPTTPKTVSYVRAAMKSAAESRGRNPIFAEAMVEQNMTLYWQEDGSVSTAETDDVFLGDYEILTLTAKNAKQFGYLDGTAEDIQQILEMEQLNTAEIRPFSARAAELFVRIITNPTFSALLMLFALAGIYMEIQTPGFGFPGILGFSSLVLFFFGHYIAGLAGWEEVILLAIGAMLLLLEFFVIPGFGITGILGIVFLAVGIVFSFLSNSPQSPFFLPELMNSLNQISLILLIFGVFFIFVMVRFFYSRFAHKLVLHHELQDVTVYSETGLSVGETGIALAPLRPTGMARFGGKRCQVIAYSDFIEKDEQIEIKEIRGNKILVEVKK